MGYLGVNVGDALEVAEGWWSFVNCRPLVPSGHLCTSGDPISWNVRNHTGIDVVKLLAVQDVGRADVRVLERRERYAISGDRTAMHDPNIGVNHLLQRRGSRLGIHAGNWGDSGRQAQGSNGGERQVFHSASPSLGRARRPASNDEEVALLGPDNNAASQH